MHDGRWGVNTSSLATWRRKFSATYFIVALRFSPAGLNSNQSSTVIADLIKYLLLAVFPVLSLLLMLSSPLNELLALNFCLKVSFHRNLK